MFNPDSLKIPATPNFPTHKAKDKIFFLMTEDRMPPKKSFSFSKRTPTIQADTELIVLEHGIGDDAKWAKIKYNDNKIGYVFISGIEPLEKTKPFFPLNTQPENQPNPSAKEIDWTTQQPMTVYEDEKNGAYVVHYELVDVTGYKDDTELLGYMYQARTEGTKLILEHYGKSADYSILNNLLDKYYSFSSAEEYTINLRPCSSLRVLVAIPKRYLNANSPDLVSNSQQSQPEPSSVKGPEKLPEDSYFTRTFKDYAEYEDYFNKLIEILNHYDITMKTRLWSIEPDTVSVNLSDEANKIKMLHDSINELIKKNYPQNIIEDRPDIFSKPRERWQYSLDLVIDKKNISLATIKYYNQNIRLNLTNGITNFLNSEEVKNKTSINYLITFDSKTDSRDALKEALKNAATAAQAGVIAGATGVATTALAGFGIGLLGGNPEEEIKKFLISKHYPFITNISPQPVDLYNCTVDTLTRIKDLASVKVPNEIKKYELLNKKYEAAQKKKEADLFIRSLTDLTQVKDKNFRILFGIDKPKGDAKQQLNAYIAVAKSLDWARFIGLATQCLSKSLPPEIIAELLKKYQEARKYLEQMFLATVCNPYLKNGLKIINGFELPTLPTYNPNQSLADEIERAVIKLLNDLIAEGIKKALEAASKACLNDPTANFNNNLPFTNPIDQAANINDPALNDLLDDFYGSLKNGTGPLSETDKNAAKEKLNSLIADITSCLTLAEICKLYKGESLNDEVYQIIISLVKRKYGSPFTEKFNNREYINYFFRTLGSRLDLSVCPDVIAGEGPIGTANILCDDGRVQNLRKDILSNKGLSPEMIDSLLEDIRKKETKNLEDVLKILNSDNPFDFSSAPDLGCKVFPNGETIGPSADSFNQMLNTMFGSVYNTFDREAEEWYKTTYSIKNGSKPNFLEFVNGEIRPKENIIIPSEQGDAVRANSGKDTPEKQEENSNKSTGAGSDEVKLPSYMFKDALSVRREAVLNYLVIDNSKYLRYYQTLDGNKQQKLDIDVIQDNLRDEIQKGEALLSTFVHQFLNVLNSKLGVERISALANVADNTFINNINSIISVLRAFDIYARSNIADSQDTTLRLNNLYKQLNLGSAQEANALFAAEEGAAVYLSVCAQIEANRQKLEEVIPLTTNINSADSAYLSSNIALYNNFNDLLEATLTQYRTVQRYYKTVLKSKVAYPDFSLEYLTALQKINLRNGLQIPTYYSGSLYDLQQINITKNSKNYIKITQANQVDTDIVNYITNSISSGGLGINDLENKTKEDIFNSFIAKSIANYGLSNPNSGIFLSIDTPYEQFKFLNEKIFDNFKQRINRKENKFLYLKDSNGIISSAIAESGSGQPFTQYLKLVVKQTPQQKACGIRPHYLDIDSIKKDISDEKAKNVCVEKIIDEKIKNNEPVNSREIENMQTTGTQKTMLAGAYRLTLRTFLHDIILRSIGIFGNYDPQSLRDEPAFIQFMTDIVESEMRGMDNIFFNMMTSFLLQKYKEENPDEEILNETLKKRQLLFSLVKTELSDYVLPKLAKRIDVDTNISLAINTPPDNPIKLINVHEDAFNLGILTVKNKAIYIKIKIKVLNNNSTNFNVLTNQNSIEIEQKIYENLNASNDTAVKLEFISKIEYDFLFKYIFPLTQVLNYFFILNCLSTTTRRQIVQAFKDTKKDIILTTKLIQTNGQRIIPDPNNAQAVGDFNIAEIMAKFVIKALIKTPISIIKGMAEGSEPNIALISTAYKAAKVFKPDLTSFMIPAASIPLGTIPTPITCPLPYINPILAATYFGTLAWYDDGFPDGSKNILDALDNLEKNIGKEEIVCNSDTRNEDIYYLSNGQAIGVGNYNLQANQIFTNIYGETTPEQAVEQIKQGLIENVIITIFNELKEQYSLDEQTIKSVVRKQVNNFNITTTLDKNYNKAKDEAKKELQAILDSRTPLLTKLNASLDFVTGFTTEDENQASIKGGVYLDAWIFVKKPTTYLAFEQIVKEEYDKFINEKITASGATVNSITLPILYATEASKEGQTIKDWLRTQLVGIKFYGE
jgi:hypothetical protein